MSAPGSNNPSGDVRHEQEGYEGEEEGPREIFLDDDDIAELQAVMDEEGDVPMDEDDDDVEEVTEAPDGYDGTEGEGQAGDEMDEAIPDQALRHFTAHEKAVFSVAAHPTCPVLVVTGGEDDNGFLWRTDTGEEIAKLTGHTDSVVTTGWSSDGEMVATGGMDGLVRVWRRVQAAPGQWEWSRWEFLAVLEGMDEVTWLDWHPKGAVLICGTQDGTVWMWQLPSGRNMAVFSGHTAPVTCGKFLPDGKKLVTGSEDGSFIIWDPKTSSPVHKLSSTDARFRLEDGITCVAINGTGTSAIVGGADGGLRVVNLTNGQLLSKLEGHETEAGSSVEAVAWSQGTPGSVGLWISVGTDKKIRVFEASNGSVRWTGEHEDAISSLSLHPPQTHLVTTGSVDRTLKTWDLRTGNLVKTQTSHEDAIHAVAVACDGRTIVSGSDDGTARVFNA